MHPKNKEDLSSGSYMRNARFSGWSVELRRGFDPVLVDGSMIGKVSVSLLLALCATHLSSPTTKIPSISRPICAAVRVCTWPLLFAQGNRHNSRQRRNPV